MKAKVDSSFQAPIGELAPWYEFTQGSVRRAEVLARSRRRAEHLMSMALIAAGALICAVAGLMAGSWLHI